MKPLPLSADNPVRVLEGEPYLYNIFILGDHVNKWIIGWHGSCKLVIAASFCCKILLYSALTEKWQLKLILKSSNGRMGMLQVPDSKGGCIWRRLWVWILHGNMLGSATGKTQTGGGIRSKYWSVVVKGYLRYKMITSQNVPSEPQIKNFFIL